jgi:hypothetical protein
MSSRWSGAVSRRTPSETVAHIIFDHLFSADCLGPSSRHFGIDLARGWTSIPDAKCQLARTMHSSSKLHCSTASATGRKTGNSEVSLNCENRPLRSTSPSVAFLSSSWMAGRIGDLPIAKITLQKISFAEKPVGSSKDESRTAEWESNSSKIPCTCSVLKNRVSCVLNDLSV